MRTFRKILFFSVLIKYQVFNHIFPEILIMILQFITLGVEVWQHLVNGEPRPGCNTPPLTQINRVAMKNTDDSKGGGFCRSQGDGEKDGTRLKMMRCSCPDMTVFLWIRYV